MYQPTRVEVIVLDAPTLWPMLALRGSFAILFGILALAWPSITVLALALLFAIWAFIDGVTSLIASFRQARARANWRSWVPQLVIGLLGVAAGVITVIWPTITVLALAIVAGVFAIVVGVTQIKLAVRLRKVIRREILLGLAGLAAVIAGVLILAWPGLGALTLTILLGAFALVSGALTLGAAWRLRNEAKGATSPSASAAGPAGGSAQPA
jgi:uncharacterized membrane protein HdeD (DUF308 family)